MTLVVDGPRTGVPFTFFEFSLLVGVKSGDGYSEGDCRVTGVVQCSDLVFISRPFV